MEIVDLENSLSASIIIHDTINKMFGTPPPHEQIFINLLLKHLEDVEIPLKFVVFAEQYFPNYLWHYVNYHDLLRMVALECSRFSFVFEEYYKSELDVSNKYLKETFKFGEIVTKFCIQYLNYSLIGCGGAKSIITAHQQCDKKFDEFLSKGYYLLRMPKIYYVPSKTQIFGYFDELPVLPTENLYYGNDEFIKFNSLEYRKVLK